MIIIITSLLRELRFLLDVYGVNWVLFGGWGGMGWMRDLWIVSSWDNFYSIFNLICLILCSIFTKSFENLQKPSNKKIRFAFQFTSATIAVHWIQEANIITNIYYRIDMRNLKKHSELYENFLCFKMQSILIYISTEQYRLWFYHL